MGALTVDELRAALAARAEIAVWREGFRELCSRVAAELGHMARVHVKLDSGMGRLGERDPEALIELARACVDDQRLDVAGVWTHFATADEEGDDFMSEQLAAFAPVAEAVRELASDCTVHAANSAATLRDAGTHFDMVRCGIAVYGLDPFGRDPTDRGLEPALELHSYVADVKRFERGASAGYGRTWRAPRGHLGRGAADRLRRRRAPRALQQRRRAGRRAALSRSSARSRWTTSPSTSDRRPMSSRARRRS